MGNIYDGCESNTELISSISLKEFYKKLEQKEKEVHNTGKKVVFVDISGGMVYEARVVIYLDTIPKIMQEYNRRIYKFNGKWIRGGLLGYCDNCNEYTELTRLCDKGHICENCFNNEIKF